MRFLFAAAPLALVACAHPGINAGGVSTTGAEAPKQAVNESCVLATGGNGTGATKPTITVGLTEPVDPRHAPIPRNDAERLVFRHLYETPVRLDCQGHALPQLAEQWVRDDGGRRWTFRLREGAQFWDGAPVTAQDVVFGRGGPGYTLSALETRVVTVSLAKPSDDLPPALGDWGMAVTKAAPDSGWPIGTGAYWATSATTTAQQIRAHSARGDTLVFRLQASGDARDLLDSGVDLLVTRDPALRDYATTLKDFSVIALPWDRTYVYVTAEAGGTRFDGLEQSVRGDARRADGGFWWLDLRACGSASNISPPAPTGPHRIIYTRGDQTARELAGRLAALTHAVAAARSADDFGDALTTGREWGYVLALPRVTTDQCRTAKDLLPSWASTITALVDTRPTAIVRRGVARWATDLDGTLHLVPPP